MSGAADDWKRLGDQLVARRVELNDAWSNRSTFTQDTGVDYRVVYDLEKARRTNFSPAMIRRLEKAYQLRAGAIHAILAGDDIALWGSEVDERRAREARDGLRVRSVVEDGFEAFLVEAKDAIRQLPPEQREEAERTTVRLLRAMLRDMGADI
ncbi:hypothetical protein FLW53_23270 [Microbispora sp. SCL1-1]|uniref:hypothetical protein n=1 Tax=unclassified Microbispora TaxID=2614687 RepID=UPI00115AAA88|nr:MULTISPECIES: hypothetical protein [unclassified Microbispora]NJP27064.1 hypothetical protein [Microbispora sp. CL1-1]TQS11412.1 hypothetical protein FLW53_23270 [Microbispora sp. SCL1-1]